MMMKKASIFLAALAALMSSGCNGPDPVTPAEPEEPQAEEIVFAKGADISWVTEMEGKGHSFLAPDGRKMECTALMQSLGFNSIRLRVWVDPKDGWCSKADVLAKARRASALGMKLMLDFHYSDSWADPGKQDIPSAWKSYDLAALAKAVYDHTRDVLDGLKSEGMEVSWVQVGNETDTGMLWDKGKVTSSNKATDFITLTKAGAKAVREVYPQAAVVLHHSNAQDIDALQWFFDLMKTGGADYDMIGLSLYPSYWSGNGYPDWKTATYKAVDNLRILHQRYSKDIMLVEFGMPASQPEKAAEALSYIMTSTSAQTWFKGIFYWEPESEHSRNNYDYGAFEGGKPTSALSPFLNK